MIRKALLNMGLTILYIFIVTPLAYVLKVRKKKLLFIQDESGKTTYWMPANIESRNKKRYTSLY